MKKLFILVAILLIGVLAVSCGGSSSAKALKTGFAATTTIADSTSASGSTNGTGQGYSMRAMVPCFSSPAAMANELM